MKITHFGHACLLVETGGARLLFDPGTDSTGFEELRNLSGIMITHEHDDHVDYARLPALVEHNPDAVLIADRDTAAKLDGVRAVEPGESLDVGGARVSVVGGAHEPVYASIPDCANAAYVVNDGEFYHPGDSFFVPTGAIEVLALPIGGPWLRVRDAVDFLRAVSPRIAMPMHEAALAHPAQNIGMIGAFGPEATEVVALERGVAREF
ncbi:MAG TPA: MBL fold metallo-hydrolase [Galbitalea sp.]|jgi:L-ascorbate metabolism protein UlaG (beta-lactamase superfamily)|nr:MBL fold metallo-hydrolase [Galbitalea sp.]